MNRQPYCRAPRWWAPKLSPAWVRMSRRYRWRQLRVRQQVVEIEAENVERLREEVARGHGVLITPNHSAHYDSAVLYAAADRVDLPLYFMTAWQVFAMSSRFECAAMQRLGCFSVDREHNDRQAFKQAVDILRSEPYPLVIFPEGDIYHTSDLVTPFREGAAAVSLAAAKRGERPQVVLPCAIKFWYAEDPTEQLHALIDELDERLFLRRRRSLPLAARVHRIAEAALALKELDYLGHTRAGRLRERVVYLTEAVLGQLEERHAVRRSEAATPPERVKHLRKCVIAKLDALENTDGKGREQEAQSLQDDMEDLFFVMQLFSYRGDYLANEPSVERIAETLDKFEEDILEREYPTVRGPRRVSVRFGEPLEIDGGQRGRDRVPEETRRIQQAVQLLIDQINGESSR